MHCKYPAVFSLLLIFVNDSASAAPAVSVALSVYMSLSLSLSIGLSVSLSVCPVTDNKYPRAKNKRVTACGVCAKRVFVSILLSAI